MRVDVNDNHVNMIKVNSHATLIFAAWLELFSCVYLYLAGSSAGLAGGIRVDKTLMQIFASGHRLTRA